MVKTATDGGEKTKGYRAQQDPSRVFHLISACSLLREIPSASAVAATFMRELESLNAKQIELEAKDRQHSKGEHHGSRS
jgi:hypothetical protein